MSDKSEIVGQTAGGGNIRKVLSGLTLGVKAKATRQGGSPRPKGTMELVTDEHGEMFIIAKVPVFATENEKGTIVVGSTGGYLRNDKGEPLTLNGAQI